ncbi:hypothetical protein VTJ49DRAFT_7424 [Mycothermus thermophilus]|uniref:Deacetylase sirtuin-type domain-containing protein n=1 Tax=Humicola insolens TaxID=85995 RepID=A0ABR3VHF1_HUMIN
MSKEQLFQLLPLPDDGLQQVLEYAATLSKADAAEHFLNMLGDSPQVVDFISTFNARRTDPKPAPSTSARPAASASASAPASAPATAPSSAQNSDMDGVPKPRRGPKKKKANLHTPAPRQVASFELTQGTTVYKKDQLEDYMPGRSNSATPSNNNPASNSATPPPPKQPSSSKLPPSAAGTLVSDLGLPKSKPKSNPVSRTSTPGPSTSRSSPAAKISITGGTPMHGSSTALSDLDAAIRSLEVTTNPTHNSNATSAEALAARRCNCVAARHPLLEAAPNCLRCGKVICVKEGLGPCTFCGSPLLTPAEVRDMIKELRAERGREKMARDREANAKGAKPYRRPGVDDNSRDDLTVAEAMALQHRDKLLAFQAQNAKRTTVRDEAADFDPTAADPGGRWASAEERALALKRQQKLLREMEWNAKPEWEKKQQVVSIDLSGKKVLRKMVRVERPPSPDQQEQDQDEGGSHLDSTSITPGTQSDDDLLQDIANALWKSRKVVVITGAGISTNSGIPDFRSENGLYSLIQAQYDAAQQQTGATTTDVDQADEPFDPRPTKRRRRACDGFDATNKRNPDIPDVQFPGLRNAATKASETTAKPDDAPKPQQSGAADKTCSTSQPTHPESLPQPRQDEIEVEPQLPETRTAPLPSSPPVIAATPHVLRKLHLLDVPPGSSSPLSSPPPITFDPYQESSSSSSDSSRSDSEEASSASTPMLSSQASSSSVRNTLPVMKGRDLFDSQIWGCPIKTSVFYTFVSALREKVRTAEPTRSHRFVSVLRDSRKLVRCYTQNIDQLEERVGLSTSLSLGTGSRYRFSARAGRNAVKSTAPKSGDDTPDASQSASQQQQQQQQPEDKAEGTVQQQQQQDNEAEGATQPAKQAEQESSKPEISDENSREATDAPPQPPAEQDSPGDVPSQSDTPKSTAPTGPNRGVECVFLHGSLAELRCFVCARTASWDDDRMTDTMAGRQPTCPHCAGATAARQEKGKRALGVGKLRPDIVLYGEDHPQAHLISTLVQHDLSLGPDMLLILGTSLRVHGLKVLVREFAKAVHDRGGKVVFVNFTKPPESVWADIIDYWVQWDCDAWVDDLQARKPILWLPPGTVLPEEEKSKAARLSRRQSGGEKGAKRSRESDGSSALKQEESDLCVPGLQPGQAPDEKTLPLRPTPPKAAPKRPTGPPKERKLNPDAKRPASIRDHKQNGAYLQWSIIQNLHRITGDGPIQPESSSEAQPKRRGGRPRKSAPAALEPDVTNPTRQDLMDVASSPAPHMSQTSAESMADSNLSISAVVKTRKRKETVTWRNIKGVLTRIAIPNSDAQDSSPRTSTPPPNIHTPHGASLPFIAATFCPSPIPESRRLPPPTPTTPRHPPQNREPLPQHTIPPLAPIRDDPSASKPSTSMDMIDAGFRETDRLIAQVHQETLLSRPSSPRVATAPEPAPATTSTAAPAAKPKRRRPPKAKRQAAQNDIAQSVTSTAAPSIPRVQGLAAHEHLQPHAQANPKVEFETGTERQQDLAGVEAGLLLSSVAQKGGRGLRVQEREPDATDQSWCPDEQLREEHEVALALSAMRGHC